MEDEWDKMKMTLLSDSFMWNTKDAVCLETKINLHHYYRHLY